MQIYLNSVYLFSQRKTATKNAILGSKTSVLQPVHESVMECDPGENTSMTYISIPQNIISLNATQHSKVSQNVPIILIIDISRVSPSS